METSRGAGAECSPWGRRRPAAPRRPPRPARPAAPRGPATGVLVSPGPSRPRRAAPYSPAAPSDRRLLFPLCLPTIKRKRHRRPVTHPSAVHFQVVSVIIIDWTVVCRVSGEGEPSATCEFHRDVSLHRCRVEGSY